MRRHRTLPLSLHARLVLSVSAVLLVGPMLAILAFVALGAVHLYGELGAL